MNIEQHEHHIIQVIKCVSICHGVKATPAFEFNDPSKVRMRVVYEYRWMLRRCEWTALVSLFLFCGAWLASTHFQWPLLVRCSLAVACVLHVYSLVLMDRKPGVEPAVLQRFIRAALKDCGYVVSERNGTVDVTWR